MGSALSWLSQFPVVLGNMLALHLDIKSSTPMSHRKRYFTTSLGNWSQRSVPCSQKEQWAKLTFVLSPGKMGFAIRWHLGLATLVKYNVVPAIVWTPRRSIKTPVCSTTPCQSSKPGLAGYSTSSDSFFWLNRRAFFQLILWIYWCLVFFLSAYLSHLYSAVETG